MKAIICHKYGSSAVMGVETLPSPVPKKNEVLVSVKAASVNPVDWKIRRGALKIKTGMKPPKILGSDFSGVVMAVGSNMSEYQVGDEVWGKFDSFRGGSYAQMVVAQRENISKKPKNLDYFQAASMPNVALTAYQAMLHRAELQQQQPVMINGASGGVGLMAVQIAKTMACHITATCGPKNFELVKSLGADVVVDYRTADILAAKQAYEVFFDCVANQSFFKLRSTLKTGGTHVKTTPDLISLIGSLLKPLRIKRADHIMVKPSHDDLNVLKDWVEKGQVKPIVQQVFPMHQVRQAHQLSEEGHVVGKLVLDMH